MSIHSVYWIRHQDHTDIVSQGYIGVSINAPKRFTQHLKRTQNKHLAFAINKYGWDNLVKSVVLFAEKDYCLDIERKLRPSEKIGWNLTAGGGFPPTITGPRPDLRGRPAWNKGKRMSEQTIEKIRDAVKLQMQDPAHRAKLSDIKKGLPSPMAGKKHSPETVERMRSSKTGVPSKKRGKKLDGVTLENVQTAARVAWTCPHCAKQGMGRGAANRWHFDLCKAKDIT